MEEHKAFEAIRTRNPGCEDFGHVCRKGPQLHESTKKDLSKVGISVGGWGVLQKTCDLVFFQLTQAISHTNDAISKNPFG